MARESVASSPMTLGPADLPRILEAPRPDTLQGLRDRAVLSVILGAGLRRGEITRLRVRDFDTAERSPRLSLRQDDALRVVAVDPDAADRVADYLAAAAHGWDLDGPLFRPVRKSRAVRAPRGALRPEAIDHILRKYASQAGRATLAIARSAADSGASVAPQTPERPLQVAST